MKEHLIKQVMEIMQKIEDTQDLIKIYTVAKTYYGIQLEEKVRAEHMTEHYKTKLIEMLDKLSEKALKRLYQLAEYLYIYKEKGGEE